MENDNGGYENTKNPMIIIMIMVVIMNESNVHFFSLSFDFIIYTSQRKDESCEELDL